MKTIIEENDRGEIIYKKNLDCTEAWYEDGICVKMRYPDGYEVRHILCKNRRIIIRIEDNEGFYEDLSAHGLYSQ